MFLSQTSRYALQAACFLAAHWDEDRPITVGDIANELDVPRNYLSKTLHQLARHGVLHSERGARGGFRLAAPPGEIRLSQIVRLVEPDIGARYCLLGRPACRDDDPCPAHARWRSMAEDFNRFLEETTLADLARNG
ncbi:MAG: RrF2 family transcriptional regulator [Myxococcota bacterium]